MYKAALTVPNILTLSRVGLIPVIAVILYMIDPKAGIEKNFALSFWGMIVFAVAGITDVVDGYIARKLKKVSNLGKFIDPMADKLIHMAAMIMLIPLGRISAWVVVVLLFREIFISGLRAVAAGEGIIISAAEWGKKKTAWLNVAICCLILYYPVFEGTPFRVDTFLVGNFCLVVGFVYSVASALMYTFHFFKSIKKSEAA